MFLNTRIYGKIKRSYQSLLVYTKEHPMISFAYLLVFTIAVLLRLFVWSKYGSLQWDEGSHSMGGVFISKLLLNISRDPVGFFGDYLTRYPNTIDSLWFYPPGYSLFTALAYLLLGYNEFVARLPSLIFSILLVHATIRVSKEIDPSETVALVSAFFIATSSSIIIVGSGAMVDVPLTTLIMYSILFFIKGIKNYDNSAFLKAGLLGGLGGLMKPTGAIILIFMIAFVALISLTSKNSLIFSRGFWKGIVFGFLLFSTWWGSALLLKVTVGGWIGQGILNAATYWFNIGGYVPPWYSPPWYRYEGWTYYAENLVLMMGTLLFVFTFIGVGHKLREIKRNDLLLTLFALSIYVFQSFLSNKNPRYVIPLLPILCIYSSIGLNAVFFALLKTPFPRKKSRLAKVIKVSTVALLTFIALFGILTPTFIDITSRHTPGMEFGYSPPVFESVKIALNDGESGLIIPDLEDNWFNVPILTFYTASMDPDRKYGVCWAPSKPEDILSFSIGEKRIRYVLVYYLNSSISKYINSNPELFIFLGKAENTYGVISVYKVVHK